MKVLCDIILCVIVLCAVWGTVTCAVGKETPPPLASYNFGVTGEPAKIDTAFGNLGEVGPGYDVSSKNGTITVPATTLSPEPTSTEEEMSQNETISEGSEQPQVTSAGSNSKAPTQTFDTSYTPASALTSATTEKSIVPSTTPKTAVNGSASTAGDIGTTAPIDVSTTETEFPTEAATNASTTIPGEQSVSPSQTFVTGKPTAGPGPIGNATKPGQQNGTATVEFNSSIVVRPLTTIYCLGSVVLLISKTMY